MEGNWSDAEFGTKEWRTGRILAGIDEIQQELDDQIVKTQAMHGSRYVKPFLARVDAWEHTLTSLQDIIDNWLKVQAAWLYLEPIFSSDDITRQLPTESSMFTVVNGVWIESMAETAREPAVLSVARREGLLEQLTDANEKLDVIQKGLSDYLETKRLAFPRFFFLSNDELLEILAETKDPTRSSSVSCISEVWGFLRRDFCQRRRLKFASMASRLTLDQLDDTATPGRVDGVTRARVARGTLSRRARRGSFVTRTPRRSSPT